jgi:hypothetical protein
MGLSRSLAVELLLADCGCKVLTGRKMVARSPTEMSRIVLFIDLS